MNAWEVLIKICEKNRAHSDYVAECIYAYLAEHGEDDDDRRFMNELLRFMEGVERDEIPFNG